MRYPLAKVVGMVCCAVLSGMLVAAAARADSIPRPEHPNPQMMRADWLSLNGEWEFAETDGDKAFLGSAAYPDRILVPFCRESALSGLGRTGFVKNVWYRRQVELLPAWAGKEILLHVGASDWRTTVYVNDTRVGEHVGGSAAFAFNITGALKPGKNTLVIHAFDDTRSGLQACGKQSQEEKSHGCVYTRTTGIWQTVWLEAVSVTHIKRFEAIPDLRNGAVRLKVYVENPGDGMEVTAVAMADGVEAGRMSISGVGTLVESTLTVANPRLWTPADPFLYDLLLTVKHDGSVVDEVNSYFGMRSVEIKGRAVLINGQALFQRLVLDQGFYPDGIWTAPAEDALKKDILLSQAAGFNGARLHQKVFEPRFLYWADKLGYLVWGEFPNWGLDYTKEACNGPVVSEWQEIVCRDFNHPAIMGWCPFNETPVAAVPLQKTVVDITKDMDASRPVLETSGYTHGCENPLLIDAHDYDQNPESFADRYSEARFESELPPGYGDSMGKPIPFFVSEYGGIGWNLNREAWGYGNTPDSLDALYTRHEGLTKVLLDNRFMFGFCYTQLTNIEQEQNGIYNYDRTPKFDVGRIRASNMRPAACETNPPVDVPGGSAAWTTLVGGQPDGDLAATWRYHMEKASSGWEQPSFDDSGWRQGKGAFGKKEGFEKSINTPWSGEDIFLRTKFAYDGAAIGKALLMMHYDNDTRVFLNGKPLLVREGWNDRYDAFEVTGELMSLLKPGENTLAVHTRQEAGGQFIDVALFVAP